MGKPAESPEQHSVVPTAEGLRRNREAIALIREWLGDESGYDEATFPALKRGLEESRAALLARPPFDAD